MTIYHGGYQAVETPRIIEGEFAKDFGNSFYCTEIKEQAVRWSKRYPAPVVSIYDYQENPSLKILLFKDMTEEWLDFIVDCRHGVINFCTPQALQCLTFKGSEEVKNERTGR